ncbi:MAG: hypothetical protein KDF59_11905 [Nitrosomonas sp.]|nr:hypothetical protein [Nitrosomonas sp.]
MDIRRTGFSFDGLGCQLWICGVAARQRCPELSYTCHQRVVKKQVTAIKNWKGASIR